MIKPKRHFAICVNNSDYEASLILRKIYEILADEAAARDDLLRIVLQEVLVKRRGQEMMNQW